MKGMDNDSLWTGYEDGGIKSNHEGETGGGKPMDCDGPLGVGTDSVNPPTKPNRGPINKYKG